MATEEELIQDIQNLPYGKLRWQTRLIYADWLDQQDDPRGEYIRVLLELERLEWLPKSNKILRLIHQASKRLYELHEQYREQGISNVFSDWFKATRLNRSELSNDISYGGWTDFYKGNWEDHREQ